MKGLLSSRLSTLIPAVHWRQSIAVFIVVFFILVTLYHETFFSIVSIWWRSETFAHGIFIIPFVGYMIWTQRSILVEIQPQPSWWGLSVMGASIVVWLLGQIINVLVIQQLAVLGMLWALFFGVLGLQVIKAILFPIAYLFFMIPVGESLIPVLMEITATFTVKALVLTGFPVFREGNYFTIPSGNYEVAKACSGVRYLFATVALGGLFAYLNYRSIKKRLIFMLVAILLPIIANGFRAYGIVLIAHYSDMKYAVGVDHFIYGWVFFGFIIFLLFYIGSRFRDDDTQGRKKYTPVITKNKSATALIYLSLLTLIFSGAVTNGLLGRSIGNDIADVNTVRTLSLSKHIGEWEKNNKTVSDWAPEFYGASHIAKESYLKNNDLVQLYVAYYVRESQDAELINQINKLYEDATWKRVNSDKLMFTFDNKDFSFNQLTLKSGQQYRKLIYWYDANGYTTTNIYLVKLIQAMVRLFGDDIGSAVAGMVVDVNEIELYENDEIINAVIQFHAEVQTSLKMVRDATHNE